MKFQMQFNPETCSKKRTEKKSNKPSITIPDQSFTVAELIERNRRGLPLGGGRTPIYHPDPENDMTPDLQRMDLAEIQELKEAIKSTIAENQGKLRQIENNRRNQEVNRLRKKLQSLQKQLEITENPEKPAETGKDDLPTH